MYNVSNDYINVMRSNDRPVDEVYGTLTFADGSLTPLTINKSIIPQNSVTISRQCIDGDDLEFGGVFSHILNIKLRSDLPRYAFYEGKIELSYRVMVNNDWEVVPLGVFTVTDAETSKNIRSLKAYDNMRLLDKPIRSSYTATTAFNLLNAVSIETGMELSFNASDVSSNFVNADKSINISTDSGLKTYRDVVKVVCQVLGCFAQADRYGRLELRKFSTTVDGTFNVGHWYNITVADYISRYISLSVTGESGTYSAGVDDEIGNALVISDAPAWDKGNTSDLQSMVDNLFELLHEIEYTPVNIDMPSDPAIDCGDRLRIVASNGTVETIITNFEWKWHAGMEIDSKGVNPYFTNTSSNTISSVRLMEKARSESGITYHRITSPKDIVIDTTNTVLYEIDFAVGDTTDVNIWHEFNELNEFSDSSQSVQLFYYYDNSLQTYSPTDTYSEESKYHTQKGDYFIENVPSGVVHKWRVEARCDSGTATIKTGNLIATLWGQKVVAVDTSGNIEITDFYTLKALGTPRPVGLFEGEVFLGDDTLDNARITEDNAIRITEEGAVRIVEEGGE